ncbi:MAG: Smr/MutS family protein [Candidatus Paceibacterota bacterium]|jgi:DNA-nicking Smr family endonuclease
MGFFSKRAVEENHVDAEIDCHRFGAGATPSAIESFVGNTLWELRVAGAHTVRVIVGKGLHSQFGPVVKPTVEHLLTRLKTERRVKSFSYERIGRDRHENTGAIIVTLF